LVAVTINYSGKTKVEAPAPLPKAPTGLKGYDAVAKICGDKLLKKLYAKGLVPHTSPKLFMVVTKAGLLVYSSEWPPGLFEKFSPFMAMEVQMTAPQALQAFLTDTMNQGYLKYEAFLAKQEAAAETANGNLAVSLGDAAKALNLQFATGKEPAVKLGDATKMYQQVFASEPHSRYVVVAMAADLKFAARLLGEVLSLRVEGVGLKKHKDRLTVAGFSKFGEDYASVHLAITGDKMLAAKTLGAVLMGLGLPLLTPWPDVSQCEKGK
jgi:hypothetical protein